MSSRKLKVKNVEIEHILMQPEKDSGLQPQTQTVVTILFSRKLTQLECSGVVAVLEGEIK